MSGAISDRMGRLLDLIGPTVQFLTDSRWARLDTSRPHSDFVVGNPHEMPLATFVEALQRWTPPQNKNWYAYKMNEAEAVTVVAAALRERHGLPFEPSDICMTNGAFAGLTVALSAIVDPGDEVIFISPPWFFYELLIAAAGATPVRVKVQPTTFDLDLAAIEAAITPRTRAIILNTPHNPTGKIYPAETLQGLAAVLTQASERAGRPIYILSDEAYSRIVFDGRPFFSPTRAYPHTILVYTYGKILLTPGQRLGYLALPPTMPQRAILGAALLGAQVTTGYAFPNALLQHALGDLERVGIDMAHLQRKRDHMVGALRGMGYEVTQPEGTFYLLARSPWPDDRQFIDLLADGDVYCLPGSVFEMPGYFRISLTANDDMINRALPVFAAALAEAHQAAPVEA